MCISAGEYLNILLKEKGIGQIILAQDTGLSTKTINSICKGKSKITPKVAVLLEHYLPPEKAEFWLELETKHSLAAARNELNNELDSAKDELRKVRLDFASADYI